MELKLKRKVPIVATHSTEKHRSVHSIVVDSDMEEDVNVPSRRKKSKGSGEKKKKLEIERVTKDDDLMEKLQSLSPHRESDLVENRSSKRMLPTSVRSATHKLKNELYLPTY